MLDYSLICATVFQIIGVFGCNPNFWTAFNEMCNRNAHQKSSNLQTI